MLLLAKINCAWVAVCAKAGAATSTTIASIAPNNINFLNFFLLTRRGSHSRPILLILFPEVDHLHQCQIICWYLPLEIPSFLFTDSDTLTYVVSSGMDHKRVPPSIFSRDHRWIASTTAKVLSLKPTCSGANRYALGPGLSAV